MPTLLRTKRNFKGLPLPQEGILPPPPLQALEPGPILAPTRPAPVAITITTRLAKKRPPPLKTPNLISTPTHAPAPRSAQSITTATSGPNAYHATLSSTLARLDAEIRFEHLRNEDLRDVEELGQGNGGSVMKVEHMPTGTIMAKKSVLIDARPSVRKQILRELQISHDCNSEYIISFWGAFHCEPSICICMEYMDKGSLDIVYTKIGPIAIDVVGKVAIAVLEGLTYLYDVHRIIHRDIKPSNILCNSRGQIKICDFGVSGEVIDSIAHTFVGTSIYMSPERIQGEEYSVKSDVWSLGITLIELALARFPFSECASDDSDLSDIESILLPPDSPGAPPVDSTSKIRACRSAGVIARGGQAKMSIIELLHHIVQEPAPRLTPEGRFPKDAEEFVDCCLLKNPDARKTPQDLLHHEWIENARARDVDLVAWAATF